MPTQDLVLLAVRRVLPLAAALLSVSRLVTAVMLALVSPMAMAGGESSRGWLTVSFLLVQPVMLITAATAGFLCFRQFTRARFATALALPALCLLGMRVLSQT